jgi:hypothetical protein
MPNIQVESPQELRQRRYREAASLLRKWAHDDPGYDERVGETLDRELDNERMGCESHDEDRS